MRLKCLYLCCTYVTLYAGNIFMIICYLYVLLHEAQIFVFMLYLYYLVYWENLHDHLSLCFIA